MAFKIGDRVEMKIDDPDGNADVWKGRKGTVRAKWGGFLAVRFRGLKTGWDITPRSVDGWLVAPRALQLVPTKALPKKKKKSR